jgi:DNA-binding IclR family transcriptional regulator
MSSDDDGNPAATQAGDPPTYRVPALEKGLDLLECLAWERRAMTQAQLARALGRGSSELFRTLATLERRGYLRRDPVSGAYEPTLRLYELGHAHSPWEQLRQAAERPMRELTAAVRESCHLSVAHHDQCLVLHQEESPLRVRLSVEVGSTIPLHQAASGRVLLAMLGAEERAAALDGLGDVGTELGARLDVIRDRGYEAVRDETTPGVSDLSVGVGAGWGRVRAALAISALPSDHAAFVAAMLPPLRSCATTIAWEAGLVGEDECREVR